MCANKLESVKCAVRALNGSIFKDKYILVKIINFVALNSFDVDKGINKNKN